MDRFIGMDTHSQTCTLRALTSTGMDIFRTSFRMCASSSRNLGPAAALRLPAAISWRGCAAGCASRATSRATKSSPTSPTAPGMGLGLPKKRQRTATDAKVPDVNAK